MRKQLDRLRHVIPLTFYVTIEYVINYVHN